MNKKEEILLCMDKVFKNYVGENLTPKDMDKLGTIVLGSFERILDEANEVQEVDDEELEM